MSIQVGEGYVALDTTDWQRTVAGVRIGIKIRDLPAWGVVAWICELVDGTWTQIQALDPDMAMSGISVDAWIARSVGIFNTWLAGRFPGASEVATVLPSTQGPGTLIEQIDVAIPLCVVLGSPTEDWSAIRRIAVIGDSISSRMNGAAAHSWPELLDSMIRSLGVFNLEVRNYSVPGLTWATAHIPTAPHLIGGTLSPVAALAKDGCDLLLICLGVNDRVNPNALADAQAFIASLPSCRVLLIRQNMFDATGTNDSVVTQPDQAAMDAVYAALGVESTGINLGFLYDMGYSFDMLHPTNSGKQWIASAVYMCLQKVMALTPIDRNIGWLHAQTKDVREQFRLANT